VPQEEHACALASVRASLRAITTRLPLVNGAAAGADASTPDVAALRAVLDRAAAAAARMRPALQRLLGSAPGDCAGSAQPSAAAGAEQGSAEQSEGAASVLTTAAYARELIDVACDEVSRLGRLRSRLDQLSDAALYAASLQVQLLQIEGRVDVGSLA
jgi:hypothetical protein